jgi:hypothetical protein
MLDLSVLWDTTVWSEWRFITRYGVHLHIHTPVHTPLTAQEGVSIHKIQATTKLECVFFCCILHFFQFQKHAVY